VRASEVQVPITIESFPSTTRHKIVVSPGDLIVADLDGVITIPKGMISLEELIKMCKKGREVDALCMKDLEGGQSLTETFKIRRG
jgi:regulator of RNase E activity RraA